MSRFRGTWDESGGVVSDVTCNDIVDPQRLRDRLICLTSVSKDVEGELHLIESERQVCDDRCETLKTDQVLRLAVTSHPPCDDSQVLDGRLAVRRFVTAFSQGSGLRRGVHTGEFVWDGAGARVTGTLSGE